MGLFFTSQNIFDYVLSDRNKRRNNVPLFPNYPDTTREEAEHYICEQFGLDEDEPIVFSEIENEPEIYIDPKLAEFVNVLKKIYPTHPDIEDPDLVLTNDDIEKYMRENNIEDLEENDIELLRMKKYVFGAADKYLMPTMDEDELRAFIEKYPRDPEHPFHLTEVSPRERERRRAKLEALRSVMTEYFLYRSHVADKYGTDIDRVAKALLQYEDENYTPPENEEIAKVFLHTDQPEKQAADRDKMIADAMAKDKSLTREAAEQQADNEIATYPARRATVLRGRVKYALDAYNEISANLEHRISSPDTVGSAYLSLLEASSIFYECDTYLDMCQKGIIECTPEDVELLKTCKSLQDKCGALVDKVANMANPCCLFLNLDELDNFNLGVLNREYEDRALKRSRELSGHPDVFSDFIGDKANHINLDRQVPISNEYKAIVEEYALSKLYPENPDGMLKVECCAEKYDEIKMYSCSYEPLVHGQPVAYRHGKRVVIFTRESDTDFDNVKLAINRPEKLFNFMFAEKNRRLLGMMADADPGYIISSPAFREMKRAFLRITEMPALSGHTLDEIARYTRAFRDMLTKCEAYLAYKGEAEGKNDLEQLRIHMATGLAEYAKLKLEQLGLVENAALTLSRYYNLTPEERKKLIEEDKQTERMVHDAAERRNAGGPVPAANNPPIAEEPAPGGNNIINEVREPDGNNRINEEPAQQEAIGGEAIAGEPENGAAGFADSFSAEYFDSIKPKQDGKYTASDAALRSFAKQSIVGIAEKLALPPDAENPDMSRGLGRELLANCVLYSMVQLERLSPDYSEPGKFESMLSSPEKLEGLRSAIKASDGFLELEKKVAAPDKDGHISPAAYSEKILTDKLAAREAKSIMVDAKIVKAVGEPSQHADVPENVHEPEVQKNAPQLQNV